MEGTESTDCSSSGVQAHTEDAPGWQDLFYLPIESSWLCIDTNLHVLEPEQSIKHYQDHA